MKTEILIAVWVGVSFISIFLFLSTTYWSFNTGGLLFVNVGIGIILSWLILIYADIDKILSEIKKISDNRRIKV